MKKIILILAVVVLAVVLGWVYIMPKDKAQDSSSAIQDSSEIEKNSLSAIQVSEEEKDNGALVEEDANSEFRPYPSVGGDVMIPKDPKRIFVALHMFAGEFAQYAADKVVGYATIDMVEKTPYLERLQNAKGIDLNNLEEIMALKPDLIYSSIYAKNNAELAKIAPTIIDNVSSKDDYFTKNIEVAGVVNKTEEAKKWVADFTKRSKKTAEKLRKKYGENISASVFMTLSDNLYYINPFGMRGAYLLNSVMAIPMPKLPKEMEEPLANIGAAPVSVEILPKISGDLILVCSYAGSNNSFTQTETWKNLPAVKKGNYLITECDKFGYVDGASMEFKLKTIEEHFLNKKDTSAIQVSEEKKGNGALVENNADADADANSDYRIFKSVHGDVKIPKEPKRIVVLSTSSSMGSILQFGADRVVGHEKWSSYSSIFKPYLRNSTLVDADNIEQIMSLNPDLIITNPASKNFAELSKIAPTLESFNHNSYDYLDAVIEYANLVNKKAEAETWVKNFKARADKVGKALKAKYGKDVSVSVMDIYGDEMYLYGDNWGRGTQILYRQMGLKMPDAVKNVALTKGYYAISAEVLPKYAGDLMIMVQYKGSNLAFMETKTWQNLPALKAGNVMIVEDGEGYYHSDSMTLSHQLDLIENYFLKDTSAIQVSQKTNKTDADKADKTEK